MLINFTEESVKDGGAELEALTRAHYDEIAIHKDIELKPRWDVYYKAEEMGKTRYYTVRDETDKLLGYALFFVDKHIHYADCTVANQDVVFLDQSIRGKKAGALFIAWCDEQLKNVGVQLVMHHVKAKPELDFSPLLEKMGYSIADKIYTKRLDKE